MKIIALSCSPSRGRNSDTMLDNFILGVKSVGGVEIEKIYLSDINIDTYTHENSRGPASHEEKFAELVEKIQNANGFVIATPTYNFSVPAHLKNFIDRLRFVALDLENRNRIGQPVGKLGYLKTYFLVSGGTPAWAEIILFFAFPAFWLRGVFLYFGAQVMGATYTGDVHSFKNEKFAKKCEKDGHQYAYDLTHNKCQGILENIFFRPPQKK